VGAMRRHILALAAACVALAAGAPPASAQIRFAPCTDAGFTAFECGTLTQPLDRTGAVPGQVDLFVRRLRAPQPTSTALVALAGGPGQAATPVAASFATALATGLDRRDLLVLDQRGTGRSGPLQCSALQSNTSTASVVRGCAGELGARRGLYRTLDSVDDIEALRVAAGYERLAFYGISYGTKVALDYAARYPDRVESLVLDSVVPQTGPDPLQRSSFRSVRPVLGELCSGRRCRGVTPSPVADIRRLVRRDRSIRGTLVTPAGRRQSVRLRPELIYEMLVAGDLNPAWRALLPGAVRAAVRGDGTPLVRLGYASLGGAPALQRPTDPGINTALWLATMCEDVTFPWDRAAPADARADAAVAALRREPGDTFLPFGRLTAASTGLLGTCLAWPNATPAPSTQPAPLPAVPALVLAGSADLRTPASDARAVAARIPGARVVTVPNVGHSVLGADPSGCAKAAIAGFFNGTGVTPCPAAQPAVRPTARPALSLGSLPTTARIRGRVGRTVTAVLRTQEDVLVHALGERIQGARRRFGGLRGGTITESESGVTLRNVVVVPGVTVSGRFPDRGNARLTVRGRRAARGSLTIRRDGRITGRLGGRRIRLVPRASSASVARSADRMPLAWPDLVRAGG